MQALLIVIFISIVLVFAIGYGFFAVGMDSRTPIPTSLMLPQELVDRDQELKPYVEALPHEDLSMVSFDGLHLAAHYYPFTKDLPDQEPTGAYERYDVAVGDDATRRLVIMCHGWRSHWWIDYAAHFHWVRAMGSDILLIEERGCGESEGRYLTYGVNESRDILQWAALMHERFPEKPIYLFGTSLGGGSVLQTISADMPDYIRGIIADSGFTSPYELFSGLAGAWFHIPAHPAVDLVRMYAKAIAKVDIRCCPSTERIAAKLAADEGKEKALQLLLIHGDKDGMVDYHMSERNYAAAGGNKNVTYLYVPGAVHCDGYQLKREEYENIVADMFVAGDLA